MSCFFNKKRVTLKIHWIKDLLIQTTNLFFIFLYTISTTVSRVNIMLKQLFKLNTIAYDYDVTWMIQFRIQGRNLCQIVITKSSCQSNMRIFFSQCKNGNQCGISYSENLYLHSEAFSKIPTNERYESIFFSECIWKKFIANLIVIGIDFIINWLWDL